jgi:hypothetical protein
MDLFHPESKTSERAHNQFNTLAVSSNHIRIIEALNAEVVIEEQRHRESYQDGYDDEPTA